MYAIAKLRKEFNVSQQTLANHLKIAQNTLSNYELGNREPDISTLIKIADYFGVGVDDILEHETSVFPMDSNKISEYLSFERSRCKYSAEEVSKLLLEKKISIPKETILAYEKNLATPPLPVFLALSQIYGSNSYMETFGFYHKDDPRINNFSLSQEYRNLLFELQACPPDRLDEIESIIHAYCGPLDETDHTILRSIAEKYKKESTKFRVG